LPRKRSRRIPPHRKKRAGSMVLPAAALLAACFVALVGVAMLVLKQIQPQAAPESIAQLQGGSGVWIERDGKLIGVETTEDLVAGDVVRTESGRAVIRYHEEATVLSVFHNTRLSLMETDGGKTVDLAGGKLMAEVAKQPQNRPMKLYSQHGTATVLGTRFVLDADANRTRLDVTEGRVRLENTKGESVEVAAGHFAVASPSVALKSTPLNPTAVAARQEPSTKATKEPRIVSFYLVDAPSGRRVTGFDPLEDGAVIDLSRLPSRQINIVAVTEPRTVNYVRWTLNSDRHSVSQVPQAKEQYEPYSMAGDDFPFPEKKNGFKSWTPKPGSYTATATAYDGRQRSGPTRTLRFTITDGP
ncbi:MAG: FecR family protein, partial [Phycisphaeraceae bacterium]|nr:FecR family protein [Phycisphaeraceae bacterium]